MIRVCEKSKEEAEATDQTAGMGLLITACPRRNPYDRFSARYHSLAFMVLEMGSCSLFSENIFILPIYWKFKSVKIVYICIYVDII